MTAVRMWVRADLRRRWRSWVVLGILAGISVGLAAAGVAGARRAEHTVPRYAAASHVPTAAVLANDARYDARQQAEVADLPEVATAYPFLVAFALEVASPSGLDSAILPTTAPSQDAMAGVLVEGRLPDPDQPDEAIVNEAVRAQYGVGIGDTITVVQQLPDDTTQFPVAPPPGASQPIEQALRIVGISDSTDDTPDWMPSAGFYKKYEPQLIGFVNQMIALRNGEADFAKFQSDVQRVTGRPTNVERGSDLFGVRQLTKVADIVRNGLLLFALAVIIGAGVLVGQALVRAVSSRRHRPLDVARARVRPADRGTGNRRADGNRGRRRRHHDRGRRDRALAAIPDRDHSSLRARRRLARGLGGARRRSLAPGRRRARVGLDHRRDPGAAFGHGAGGHAARGALGHRGRPPTLAPHRVATRRRRRTRPAGDSGAVGPRRRDRRCHRRRRLPDVPQRPLGRGHGADAIGCRLGLRDRDDRSVQPGHARHRSRATTRSRPRAKRSGRGPSTSTARRRRHSVLRTRSPGSSS